MLSQRLAPVMPCICAHSACRLPQRMVHIYRSGGGRVWSTYLKMQSLIWCDPTGFSVNQTGLLGRCQPCGSLLDEVSMPRR